MANPKTREKRRAARLRKNDNFDEALAEVENDSSPESVEVAVEVDAIEKDYNQVFSVGPTSWEELEAAKEAREVAHEVNEVTWSVQDLVYNIANNFMLSPEEKGKAIANVGAGFGKRVKEITSGKKIEKSIEVLELEAILAKEKRNLSATSKITDWLDNFKLTKSAMDKLEDSDFAIDRKLPIHNKAQIRNSLALVLNMLEKGGDDAKLAEAALPKLREAIKKNGIGIDTSRNSVIVEKDVTGQWRAVLWASNNFKDRDGEIVSDEAHREYVDWVQKNMDVAPLFMTCHTPGTARENPVDFVGYEHGFLLMSAPLSESEAGTLLKMQAVTDVGLSVGGLALSRDLENSDVITKYRLIEVSDLPLERAANPFTTVELISKEATVNTKEYLVQMLGPERAEAYLAKTALKQDDLRKAGVAEKEVVETPAAPVTPDAPAKVDLAEIVEKVSKELGMEALSEQFLLMKEAVEKVPVLEELVKELMKSKEDAIVEMIQPPATKTLSWMKESRPTQKESNVLNESEEDKKLKKSVPEAGWLSEATGTFPVPNS